MTTLSDIVATADIAAPPETVWRFLVGEEHVPRWLGCLNYRKTVGHVFHMQPDPERRAADSLEGATHCEVLVLDAPRRFAFSWYLPGTPQTEVSVELEGRDGGTRVTLTHSGWDRFEPDAIRAVRDFLAMGWQGAVLPNLKRVVEAGSPADA